MVVGTQQVTKELTQRDQELAAMRRELDRVKKRTARFQAMAAGMDPDVYVHNAVSWML